MRKIEQLVNRKGIQRKRHKPSKILSAYYLKTAKESQNFTLSITSDLDFFNAMIMIESLKNKRLFESTYERERKELTDLWPTLSYQERNKLINLKITETKKRCRSFTDDQGERIWVAFFDRLMNALYDREMNIFDLEQYFNLYRDYKKRMVPISTYGLNAYSDTFIDIKVLSKTVDRIIFYYDPLKALYRLTQKDGVADLRKLCLKPDFSFDPKDQELMVMAMDLLDRSDRSGLIEVLMNAEWVTDKVKKQLFKVQRKLK